MRTGYTFGGSRESTKKVPENREKDKKCGQKLENAILESQNVEKKSAESQKQTSCSRPSCLGHRVGIQLKIWNRKTFFSFLWKSKNVQYNFATIFGISGTGIDFIFWCACLQIIRNRNRFHFLIRIEIEQTPPLSSIPIPCSCSWYNYSPAESNISPHPVSTTYWVIPCMV